jgi:hypothetical protein
VVVDVETSVVVVSGSDSVEVVGMSVSSAVEVSCSVVVVSGEAVVFSDVVVSGSVSVVVVGVVIVEVDVVGLGFGMQLATSG